MVGELSELDQVLVEQHLHHGEQQRGIGTRARRQVTVGQRGGAGVGGIDHHQPAAATLQRAQLATEVGGRGQAPVGHQRVGADDHQVVGAVEVGHRESHRAAEHQTERNVFGHLVQRACREDLAGAQTADDQRRVERTGDGVRVRVSHVDADRGAAVLPQHRGQALVDRGERLLPGRLGQHAVPTHQRRGQPVRIVVQLSEARPLGADVTGAEHVVLVAPGADHPAVLDGQGQTAGRLTEGADTQSRVGHTDHTALSTGPRTPSGRGCRCRAGRGSARHSRGRNRRRTRWGCRSRRR